MAVNKKALLAGALCMVVIFAAMTLNKKFFSSKNAETQNQDTALQGVPSAAETPSPKADLPWIVSMESEHPISRDYVIETEVYRLTFSSVGGVLKQAELKGYPDAEGNTLRLIPDEETAGLPFLLSFGGPRSANAIEEAADHIYASQVSSVQDRIVFSGIVADEKGNRFTVRKTCLFDPEAYLIRLIVFIESPEGRVPYNLGEYLYTVTFGPQIGPFDVPIDGRNEYRYFSIHAQGREQGFLAKAGTVQDIAERSVWIGLKGKYFLALGVPDEPDTVRYTVSEMQDGTLGKRDSFTIGRVDPQVSAIEEGYTFYLGPKDKDSLAAAASHEWLAGREIPLTSLIPRNKALGWLNTAMKFLLSILYRVIPNYGIGILILAILVKLALVPVSQPLYYFHAKLRSLKPEIDSLNQRYRGNAAALNEALSAVFKRENLRTRSSILLLAIQLLLFISLYSLLGTDIAFRQAPFIPGWIPDITRPDTLWSFAPYAIPILRWQALRLLPFLFLAIILVQSRFTQSPIAGSRSMKFMSIFMPVFIFFIVYDLPAGLVLFFTVEYGLNLLHQVLVIRKVRASDSGGT